MSFGAFLVIFAFAVLAALVALRAVLRARAPDLRPAAPALPVDDAQAPGAARGKGFLDALDTVPEGVPLSDLLALREAPLVVPQGLERRAARLQERYRTTRRPEPMRALARLLLDAVDTGLQDPMTFHNALRLFLATAPDDILAEAAPHFEARAEGLAPWLALDLATPALNAVEARVPGTFGGLVAAAEARGAAEALHETDRLLATIGVAASQGRAAPSAALQLAKLLGRHPALMPRAVAEMASHQTDPVWMACWLTVETRALATGQPVNVPALRSRAMRGLRTSDPNLVNTAATAAEALVDAGLIVDPDALWSTVTEAMTRLGPPPPALLLLADRLGMPRPGAEA